MRVKIAVAGVEIAIEASPVQKIGHEENRDRKESSRESL
jgi:hypothetical protein